MSSSDSLTPPPSEANPWLDFSPRQSPNLSPKPEYAAADHAEGSRTSKRSRSTEPSENPVSPRRNIKRARELTPLYLNDGRETSASAQALLNASTAPTTGTAMETLSSNTGPQHGMDAIAHPETSEDGKESRSVLFSEQANALVGLELERPVPPDPEVEDLDEDDDQEDGDDEPESEVDEDIPDETEEYEPEDEPLDDAPLKAQGRQDAVDRFVVQHYADRRASVVTMPPPASTSRRPLAEISSNTPAESSVKRLAKTNGKGADAMSTFLDGHPASIRPRRMPRGVQELKPDDESESSYHSGDSDEFEMEHRPILERAAIKKDIRAFSESLAALREGKQYRVIDRLGEGTFSSVYLAYDTLSSNYRNSYWSSACLGSSHYKVALKKVLVTSSPARIENELAILEAVRGCRNTSQLITAFREEDQVIIVLPYHISDDFRHFYKHIDPPHTRQYMRAMLQALQDIHARGIIHRDVKPANFLFDYDTGTGVLVDFGLAERYVPPRKPTCQHAPGTLSALHGQRAQTGDTKAVEQAVYDARKRAAMGEGKLGFPQEDKRPALKANRAGTRGFRAPEVLLKCPDQTVAIDIWSVGIILLSILTQKFPVFNSSDDIEALMELSAVFGRGPMEKVAVLHNRTIITNVPTVDTPPPSLEALILRLNPHIYTPPYVNPSSYQAQDHIEDVELAINLCGKLLRLDATKRLTATAALRHPFLLEDHDSDVLPELLNGTEGKCGCLHSHVDGKHKAYFGQTMQDMQFGQGIPPSRDSFCPEHEHWQDRMVMNPVARSSRFPSKEATETQDLVDLE